MSASSRATLHPPACCVNCETAEMTPANAREAVAFATASSQTRLKQGLEFLREAPVNEPACGVIGKAGIILTVSNFAVCRWRILTKHVVASQSYTRASE